jgi:hypothetical protein
MHIDERNYEIGLHGVIEKEETKYSYTGEYTTARLFCAKCETELTKVFDLPNGDFDMNFCPNCGLDLKKGTD